MQSLKEHEALHRQWPWLETDFVFFFPHQGYNKTTLEETTLCKDLLYFTLPASCFLIRFHGESEYLHLCDPSPGNSDQEGDVDESEGR